MIPEEVYSVLTIVAILALVCWACWRIWRGIIDEPEPETYGDLGGWPIDANGYPAKLPKTMSQHRPYEDALNRFFTRRAE